MTTPDAHHDETSSAATGRGSRPETPSAEEVKAHRTRNGQTQAQAAALVHTNARTWQKYEAGENAMHPAMWELYRIKCAMF